MNELLTLGNPNLFKRIASKLESGCAVSIDIFSADENLLLEKMHKFNGLLTWNVMHGFRSVVPMQDEDGNLTGIAQAAFYFSDSKDEQALQEKVQHNLGNSLNFLLYAAPERDYTLVMFDVPSLVARFSESERTVVERALKELIDRYKASGGSNENGNEDGIKRLILIGQDIEFSDDFKGRISQIKIQRPTPDEIQNEISAWIPGFVEQFEGFEIPSDESTWQAILRSSAGLNLSEIINIVREVAAYHNCVGIPTAESLHAYKVEQLRQLGIEVLNPPKQDIGGLTNVKRWLKNNLLSILDSEDSDDELRPKGIMVIGVPGTGKSLIAKQVGKTTNLPCFKIDGSAFLGSLVGESERKTKDLLALLDSAAPAIIFFDELDKVFAGVNSSNSDGGTKRGVFGQILSWMQDLKPGLFIIGAANDISDLPPEFLRKGRWDEIFFVDLPNETDRNEIIQVHLTRFAVHSQDSEIVSWSNTLASDSYSGSLTGAEIEAAVRQAATTARNAGRKGCLELNELISEFEAAKASCLAVQQRERIEYLQQQASRFTPASAKQESKAGQSAGNSSASTTRSTVTSTRKAASRKVN